MKRRGILIGGVAGAAVAAGLGVGWWQRRRNGDPAASLWPLAFDRPDGGELRFADLRGKPLLVNFWATWCPPCVGELPLLDRFGKSQPGWRVIGLAVDQLGPVREFLVRHPVSFPIGMAGLDGVDLARRLGNNTGGLPFSLVFSSVGDVAGRKLGSIAADDLAGWVSTVR